VMGEHH